MTDRATATDMVAFFDERTIRDLLSDTGEPVIGDLADNVKLQGLLKAASGRLEAACFVSDLYTAAELDDLTDNSRSLAAEIVSTLVMVNLMRRRAKPESAELLKGWIDQAEGYLQQLRNGARLFDVNDSNTHQEAGQAKISWPTIQQIDDGNRITRRTQHFYPDTARDLPVRLGGG